MSLLSSADLAFMRETQEQAMPGTVVIERYVLTSNGMGGATEAWTAVGTAIGRIYPMQRRGMAETVAGAQVISETTWFGTFPIGTVIYPQDRLVYDSRTWEVARTNNSEMYKTAVRVDLEANNQERRT